MLRIEIGADDLFHSRFALSPLFELTSLLRVLSGLDTGRPPAAWSARLVPAFRRLRRETDLDAVLALQARHSGADFVACPPRGLTQTWEDDLRTVRETPYRQARREISEYVHIGRMTDPRVLDVLRARDAVDRLADALDAAWHELLAPQWPQLRAICERDVVHRAGELGRGGWAAALEGLHPRVRWRDGGIEVLRWSGNRRIRLDGSGLLFIPSVFVWPSAAVHTDPPWPRTIIYPARGSAALWQPAATPPGALAELVGRTRARLLAALASPASTSQLAASLGIATGAVGDHVAVMLRAGLLQRARSGRAVLYWRSPLGDALAAGSPAPD